MTAGGARRSEDNRMDRQQRLFHHHSEPKVDDCSKPPGLTLLDLLPTRSQRRSKANATC